MEATHVATILSSPDRAAETAHQRAVRSDTAEIAERLQEVLGQSLTAYAIGKRDPKAIGRYARDAQTPQAPTERRLRAAFQVVELLLLTGDHPRTVRAWFVGMNPQLGDQTPADLLNADRADDVLRAAIAFADGAPAA